MRLQSKWVLIHCPVSRYWSVKIVMVSELAAYITSWSTLRCITSGPFLIGLATSQPALFHHVVPRYFPRGSHLRQHHSHYSNAASFSFGSDSPYFIVSLDAYCVFSCFIDVHVSYNVIIVSREYYDINMTVFHQLSSFHILTVESKGESVCRCILYVIWTHTHPVSSVTFPDTTSHAASVTSE